MISRSILPAIAALSCACASGPEPVAAPKLPPASPVELFHRARFDELAKNDPKAFGALARRFSAADADARASYRSGDIEAAARAISKLSRDNNTRRVLEALLAHADKHGALRRSMPRQGAIQVALDPRALDRGYPVIEADLGTTRVRLLWDTGASENMLGPDVVDALALPRTEAKLTMALGDGGLIVRLTATATEELSIGLWKIANVPWMIADLDTVRAMRREVAAIDGFLSPQLLLPRGCFAIDKHRAVLTLGFDRATCSQLISGTGWSAPLYGWDGEIYASARVHDSPEVAVQVETGSPVTFLRSDASRYLPREALRERAAADVESIAHQMAESVSFRIAGRAKAISAINLEPKRRASSCDDIATLGNDLLLQGRGVVVSFADMKIGTLYENGASRVQVALKNE